jgi:predicted AAA+ superfamily ATPase
MNTKDGNGNSQRKQLEVDFVCNQGSKRCYIQSALRLPTEEKREQELRSLRNIDDCFQKFVITEDPIKRYQDGNGVVYKEEYNFFPTFAYILL